MKRKLDLSAFICALVLALIAIVGLSVPTQAASSKKIPTPKITGVYSDSISGIEMHTEERYIKSYDVRIYRSSSKKGTYKLLDVIPQGTRKGKKGKCYYEKQDEYNNTTIDVKAPFNKKYYYKIRLTDSSGNKSSYSKIKSCTATSSRKPELLMCRRTTSSSVKIKYLCEAFDKIQIDRKVSGGKWEKIKTIKVNKEELYVNETTYTDKNLNPKKTYKYRIRGITGSGFEKKYSEGVIGIVKASSYSSPTVSGDYKSGSSYRLSGSTSKLKAVRRVAQQFKDNFIKKGMSKEEKIRAVYDYIQYSFAYDGTTDSDRNNAYGVLVKGKANCLGCACGVKVLCDAIGVDCQIVGSNASSPISHYWNIVKIGGKWYILDAQSGGYLLGSDNYHLATWNKKDYPTVSKKYYMTEERKNSQKNGVG